MMGKPFNLSGFNSNKALDLYDFQDSFYIYYKQLKD